MQQNQQTVHEMLSTGSQRYFSIPAYQRRYEWDEQRWHDLWRDIAPHYREKETRKHFVGIAIVSQEGNFGGLSRVEVIDGQQRLTTFLILLAAIRDHQAEIEGKTLKFEQDALTYVRDADGTPTSQQILEVSETDRVVFSNVIHGGWRTWFQGSSKRIKKDQAMWAYQYFRCCLWLGEDTFDDPDFIKVPIPKRTIHQAMTPEELWMTTSAAGRLRKRSEPIDVEKLKTSIRNRLSFLAVEIEPHDESPVTIFDAINGKRTEFSQWDHSRTYLFMRLKDRAEEVLKKDWKPLESVLEESVAKAKSGNHLDQFLYEYLIARGEFAHQGSVNIRRGHAHLRSRVMRLNSHSEPDVPWIEKFIKEDLIPMANCYPTVASASLSQVANGGNSSVKSLANERLSKNALFSLSQISSFTSGPATPLTLRYVEAWHQEKIDLTDLESCLISIETFLARALLASAELSPFRAKFTKICGQLGVDYTKKTLVAALKADSDFRTDSELKKIVVADSSPLYQDLQGQQVAALFRGIERQLGGPAAHLLPFGTKEDEFTIEHIFPQDKEGHPNSSWIEDLEYWGKNTKLERESLQLNLHSLGNLALIPKKANSGLGNLPFTEKRKAFALQNPQIEIPNLNHLHSVQVEKQWTSAEIIHRSEILLNAATSRWKENF
jgi:hypothetical protein